MRTTRAIALVGIVLALGAPAARAASGFAFPESCSPGSSQFDLIACRLGDLLEATGSHRQEIGERWPVLDRSSEYAIDRLRAARGMCSVGRWAPAKRRLQRATTLIRRYMTWASAGGQGALPAALRESLLTEAYAIDRDVSDLRFSLSCPIDA